MSLSALRAWFSAALEVRLDERGRAWLDSAGRELGGGLSDTRFAALVSLASRYGRKGALAPSAAELEAAAALAPGWNPERWRTLEALRAALVLAREDLEEPAAVEALEEAFRYADEGELCALYRSLALVPDPERFAWRGGEGCRSNMRSVFEAAACDSPFPARAFDELAWNQLAIKAIFIEAPLWRVYGLDERLSEELARMALDLADERRSAGRPVQHELWLCLGTHGGQRALESIERELAASDAATSSTIGRCAAAYALARAGRGERLRELVAGEADPRVAAAMRDALAGSTSQAAFRALDPTLQESN